MKTATAAMTATSPMDGISGLVRAAHTPGVSHAPLPSSARGLTTDEFAAELGIGAQSIRKRYSQTGSYFGLRPIKLPNRRLLWPPNPVEKLLTC